MNRKLELTPRLRKLAEWVPEGAAFADVGTDHAFLPVWLYLHGRTRNCIASDLRREPLRRARETARAYGADLSFRLCDGLTGIRPDEAEVIAIAGLGGEKIAAILDKAPWTADGRHTLLLQPMTRAEELRRYLAEHGYAMRREAVCFERGTLYAVMEVTAGEMRPTAGQLYGGVRLLRDPLGDRYLIEQILRLQNVVAGLNLAERTALSEMREAVFREETRSPDGNSVRTGDAVPVPGREHPPPSGGKRSRKGGKKKKVLSPRQLQQRADAAHERADRLRDILTELLEMREAWRHANSPGD